MSRLLPGERERTVIGGGETLRRCCTRKQVPTGRECKKGGKGERNPPGDYFRPRGKSRYRLCLVKGGPFLPLFPRGPDFLGRKGKGSGSGVNGSLPVA